MRGIPIRVCFIFTTENKRVGGRLDNRQIGDDVPSNSQPM